MSLGAGGSFALDVDVDASNRAVVIGGTTSGAGIMRLLNGRPDAAFGNSGSVVVTVPVGEALARSRQGDSFYSTGYESIPGGIRAVLGHFRPNGGLDSAFGSSGLAYASSPQAPASLASAVMVQPDDRILIVGTTVDASMNDKNDMFVARFCP